MRLALSVVSMLLPWSIRRRFLNRFFGYEIHPEARIGFSWTFPRSRLAMGQGARIGHLNVIRSLDELRMDERARIESMNWITANLAGFDGPGSEGRLRKRVARLYLGRFALVTARHYFDCSDSIEILEYSSVGGIRTVWQTHNFDLGTNEQACRPIRIGPTAFVGSNCLLLGGAVLPHHTVLGAGSLLIEEKTESYRLYAGHPAEERRTYDPEFGWFNRSDEWLIDTRRDQ